MHEQDLREAMRTALTTVPAPPPMQSADALAAGRRAVRWRTALAGAGTAAVVVAVTAMALGPGLRPDPGGTLPIGAAAPGATPAPGDETKPAWPIDGDGEPQQDATARSGPRYEQGRKLLDALLTVVPAGWSAPTGSPGDGIPLRDHQAAVEPDNSWGYLATAAVARHGGTGRLIAEVHTADNTLPAEPCALAAKFWGLGGDCEVHDVGDAKVGVATTDGDTRIEQWAAYRHADGVVVYLAQDRNASNGDSGLDPLAGLPLSGPELAALAVQDRFHLQ